MSVFRNYLSVSLALSLLLSSTAVLAEGGEYPAPPQSKGKKPVQNRPQTYNKPSTAYSYDATQFCSKAPDILNNLNKENEDKLNQLDSLEDQIRDLDNAKTILNGIVKLKSSYTRALKDLAVAEKATKAAAESEKIETLDNMKKVIRNGLTMNALTMMLKDTDLEKDESFTIDGICAKNQEKTLCKQENGLMRQAGNKFFKYKSPLDVTLANFRDAFRTISKQNRPMVAEEAKKLLSSMPESISPAAIIEMLDKESPRLTDILAKTKSKEDLLTCLTDKPLSDKKAATDACERLLPAKSTAGLSDSSRISFMDELNQQTQKAVSGIKNLGSIIQQAHVENSDEIRQNISRLSEQPGQPTKKITTIFQKNFMKQADLLSTVSQQQIKLKKSPADDAPMARAIAETQEEISKLPPVATVFYKDPQNADTIQQLVASHAQAKQKALDDSMTWQRECLDPDKEIDVKKCAAVFDNMDEKIADMITDYKAKASDIKNKMRAIKVDDNDKFTRVENLKKFVAEKYLRACVDSSKVSTEKKSIKLDTYIEGTCYEAGHTLTSIKGMGQDLNNIVANMKFAQDITTKKDSTGAFTKDEMNSFTSTCNENGTSSEFNDVCGLIYGEHVAREKVKDTKDWEKFNDDYWVSYDDKSATGYSVTKKKGALRVFGEGVLPVVPQMLPTFFGNYMMKQNINTLTNQAIYQKQYLHNVDYFNSNPWMYNYNMYGFGTTGIQGYGNPFATTTTTTTGVTNTTGFGF